MPLEVWCENTRDPLVSTGVCNGHDPRLPGSRESIEVRLPFLERDRKRIIGFFHLFLTAEKCDEIRQKSSLSKEDPRFSEAPGDKKPIYF